MSTSEPWLDGQVVLILCGLVGSGKSTFATQLQEHFPKFQRCNQDELGDRRQVERLARDSLERGLSVCIDRTNFDAAQRFYWIEIAREFPGTSIWVIVFDTPYEVCAERLRTRTSHPTIKDAEHGLYVLSRFSAQFERPSAREGFHHILYLEPKDTALEYTQSEIAAILSKIHNSPPVSFTNSIESSHYTSQSFPGRQFSGRGNPARGHPSTNHQNAYRRRSFLPTVSLNSHLNWRPFNESNLLRDVERTGTSFVHHGHSTSRRGNPSRTAGQEQTSESVP